MGQDLPDDVWSQIAETWSDREALRNMSLTSKRMHRLVVPVLFRDLKFEGFHALSEESEMVRLIRDIVRARFLFNSPELLRRTRAFTLWENANTVDLIAEYLALHEGSDISSTCRGDAKNLLAVFHDTIYRLIYRMPGLRHLNLSTIVMTPLSYSAILSRPLLTSLSLEPTRLPDITHVIPTLPYALRLRDFSYLNFWTRENCPSDPYLVDILDHCLLDMERLTMPSILLPLVTSRIPLHHTLSLRSLSVDIHSYSSDGLAAAVLLQVLLRACPQLRHLSLAGNLPEVEPTSHLPPPIPPNLSTFFGTSYLLQILSGGTNLVKIGIDEIFKLKEQSLTQVIRSSPTHLRELIMGHVVISQTPHELLTFIQSLALFRNLERLEIVYELDISWKDHISAQDSHNTIKDLLKRLACLRFLHINSDLYYPVEGYDIGCPISKQGEPADRGHPSLEAIYVDFICGMWSWDSRKGWEMSNWAHRRTFTLSTICPRLWHNSAII